MKKITKIRKPLPFGITDEDDIKVLSFDLNMDLHTVKIEMLPEETVDIDSDVIRKLSAHLTKVADYLDQQKSY